MTEPDSTQILGIVDRHLKTLDTLVSLLSSYLLDYLVKSYTRRWNEKSQSWSWHLGLEVLCLRSMERCGGSGSSRYCLEDWIGFVHLHCSC